jgi:hypothetical protein
MMWWDRRDFARHAAPEQVAKILQETSHLTREYDRLYGTAVPLLGRA